MQAVTSCPAFLCAMIASLAPIDSLAQADAGLVIPWGNVIGYGAVSLLATALTWLVAGKVSTSVLRQQNTQLDKSIAEHTRMLGELYDRVGEIRRERSECEIRAVRRFATAEQIIDASATVNGNHREVMSKLDGLQQSVRDSIRRVHDRVNGHQDRLVELETKIEIGAAQ